MSFLPKILDNKIKDVCRRMSYYLIKTNPGAKLIQYLLVFYNNCRRWCHNLYEKFTIACQGVIFAT